MLFSVLGVSFYKGLIYATTLGCPSIGDYFDSGFYGDHGKRLFGTVRIVL